MPVRRRWRARTLVCLPTAIGALAAPAAAQEDTSEPPVEERAGDAGGAEAAVADAPRWSLSLEAGAGYIAEGDLDRGPGDLDIFFASAGVTVGYAIDRTSRISLITAGEYWSYDFDGATGLVAGTSEPFDDLYVARVGALYLKRIDDNWSVVLGGHVQSAGEDGSDFSDTVTVAGIAGFRYAFSESLSVGLSLLVSSRLEDDVLVIPIPTVDWRIDERWRLASETQIDSVLYVLSYQASEQWNLGLGAGFYSQRFRLDETGPVPNGLADVQRVLVAGRARYEPSEHVTIRLTGGFVVYHDIELMTAGGSKISSDEVDPAPTAGVSLEFTF